MVYAIDVLPIVSSIETTIAHVQRASAVPASGTGTWRSVAHLIAVDGGDDAFEEGQRGQDGADDDGGDAHQRQLRVAAQVAQRRVLEPVVAGVVHLRVAEPDRNRRRFFSPERPRSVVNAGASLPVDGEANGAEDRGDEVDADEQHVQRHEVAVAGVLVALPVLGQQRQRDRDEPAPHFVARPVVPAALRQKNNDPFSKFHPPPLTGLLSDGFYRKHLILIPDILFLKKSLYHGLSGLVADSDWSDSVRCW